MIPNIQKVKGETIDPDSKNSKQDVRSEQECSEAVTQNFVEELHISVTPVGDDEYLVRTEQAPKGVLPAEEQVDWPLEDWLRQSAMLMEDPLLGLLRTSEDRPMSGSSAYSSSDYGALSPHAGGDRATTHSQNLVDLGQQLYNALFQGTLLDRLTSAQAIAHNRGNVLRLRLGLKGTRLPRLPWEVIHEDSRPIATGKDIVFSRYQPTLAPLALPAHSGDLLKILMVLAAPSDRENLALKREALNLREELKKRWRGGTPVSGKPPEIELEILEQPDREQLTRALEQNHYQVLHYSGHSNVGPAGGELYLVSSKTGLTEVLTGDDFAGLLVNTGIRMAVFNSCRGAYTATSDPTDATGRRNLAEALVKRGVPGVLAMAERITDDVALTLTRLFYYNIKQGYPVDLSLNRARQGLVSAYGSHQMYWALPVLYLHPEFDGYLTSNSGTKDTRIQPSSVRVPGAVTGMAAAKTSNLSLLRSSGTRNAGGAPKPPEIPAARTGSSPSPDPEWDEEVDSLEEEDLEGVFDDLMYDDLDDEDAASIVSDLFRELHKEDPPTEEAIAPKQSQEPPLSTTAAGKSPIANTPNRSPVQPPPRISSNTPISGDNPSPAPLPRASVAEFQKKSRLKLWPLLGVVGVLAIALLAVFFWRQRAVQTSYQQREVLPSAANAPESTPNGLNSAALASASTPELAGKAMEYFTEGNLGFGEQVVEELLKPERGAINYAEAALNAVPDRSENQPAINFLRGRVAWQALQTGDSKYSLDDVRRYWTTAIQQQPNTPAYFNALAFAYYADGKLNKAQDAWVQALNLLERMPLEGAQSEAIAKQVKSTTPVLTPLESQEALTAYAGLALVLIEWIPQQPPGQQEALLSKAIKQRKMVMSIDPLNFQPNALAKNWLWPEQAVEDWRSLLQAQD